jgi:crotonobetainyl-CoA:carnitine CoA-transferase CaiB-like acyl-CoA transferase
MTSALNGIRVLDISTIYAGPFAATLLGDFGADVIKVEHPKGDSFRNHGYTKEGVGLWWKMLSRNKRTVTLDLNKAAGQRLLLQLVEQSDVIIENFRPGVMERWGLGFDDLKKANPKIVMLRTTAFGQFGPYAERPGFGTLAEAMSGFAHLTGQADGPPTLPPFGLADAISGITGALAVMIGLFNRDTQSGLGQVIDLAIIEPILMVLGPQPILYDQLGLVLRRMGNTSGTNAPRNTYKTRDDRWVAISASALRIAEQTMRAVGHPEVIDEPWFATASGRAQHGAELDEMVSAWVGEHDLKEVLATFEGAGSAIAPIYDIKQVMADPQYAALKTFIDIEDEELGPMRMQNVAFRMSETPGKVRFTGRKLGQDNHEVYAELLGLRDEALQELHEQGVV